MTRALQVRLRLTATQEHDAGGRQVYTLVLQSAQWLLELHNVDRVVAAAITAAAGPTQERKVALQLDPKARRCMFRLGDADQPLLFSATERTGLREFDSADQPAQADMARRVVDFVAGRRTVSNVPGLDTQAKLQLPEQVAFTPADLHRLLPIGRAAAYALARQLGQRVGTRKLVVSRDALQRHLDKQPQLATGRLPGQPVPKLPARRATAPAPQRASQGALL